MTVRTETKKSVLFREIFYLYYGTIFSMNILTRVTSGEEERVSAKADTGFSISMKWNNSLDEEENHFMVAERLCEIAGLDKINLRLEEKLEDLYSFSV